MIHPADASSSNPRLQCDACGRWKALVQYERGVQRRLRADGLARLAG